MSVSPPASLDLTTLQNAYAAGLTPAQLIEEVEARIKAHADPALFIARPTRAALAQRAAELADIPVAGRGPLYGIPFVVKDNIDVAGLPTTAACAEFAYVPAASASVVAKILAAGGIMIGKANLDQFATGLVGVRSPYGVPRNSFDAAYIPGGSSSGSATSVGAGLATFSLGTDTAGSGRVPAGLNNLVGLKPTPGWFSTTGVVPACRTLDCVSIFALTVADSWAVAEVVAGYDAGDPFSRAIPKAQPGPVPTGLRLGVPAVKDLKFFGDAAGEAAYLGAIAMLEAAGYSVVEIDFEPFFAVARLLYEGPWVAERYAAIKPFIEADPSRLHPVTRAIMSQAPAKTALDTFEGMYAIAAERRKLDQTWGKVDALAVPTVTRFWRIDEVDADPIATNSALGTYTNFVNFLGLAALAVPINFRTDGLPAGITFIAAGGRDAWLSSLGRAVEARTSVPLGATGCPRPPASPPGATIPEGMIGVAVVGAHLAGLPLNRELVDLGASFVRAARTASCYRFFALAGGPPFRPGLIRVSDGSGVAIETEIWALPPDGFGKFVAGIPAPLGIGTLSLDDGSTVKGFIAEPVAMDGALDISAHGGWRAYLKSKG
jgi:allophanate hydrolase